mmetsp:Transcript_37052/g.147861  ORF Transcript_37052/g.147861 Transcript_37052/m.147861 type:complete len:110 (+) Transcript_37052:837-1166(+)
MKRDMNSFRGCYRRDRLLTDDHTNCAQALKNLGAARVLACCVHPVLSGQAIDRLSASKIDRLIVTDSIPLTEAAKQCGKIDVISVSGLFSETITRIHREQSVSTLFDEE